jgi:hypothetical protein
VLGSDNDQTTYNDGAQFDCTHESYTLSFLRQPAAGVKNQALGVQPKLVLKDGHGMAVQVDTYYIQNKALVETVILTTDAYDCLCDAAKPCQHQAFGVNVCYDVQTEHGRSFCPAGTKRCVRPGADPILYSKSTGTGTCACGGLTPCKNADSTCAAKTNYYVSAVSKGVDSTPQCTASKNWDAYVGLNPKPFTATEGNHVFTSITEWCETHCNAQLGTGFYNCPSSHCTCQSKIKQNQYSCPEGANHDGSCFCASAATECGKVETSGYNAYLGEVRAHSYYIYTAQFSYGDIAIDQEGEGYVLRVCLKHAHSSQRKRVCIDSQKFPVLPDTPQYTCTATATYKHTAPESAAFSDMDNWCAVNCNAGFCPPTHCSCTNAAPGQCEIFDSAGICCPSGSVDSCGICNGDGSTCKFETTTSVLAPAEAFDTARDCGLNLPCKHDNDNTCLPKVDRDGSPCYADDESHEANTNWGVGTWGVDDTIDEAKGPTYDPAQGIWGYNAQSAAFHNLCYCSAGTTDSTTRAKWQAALREDWLADYEEALTRQAEILKEFDMSASYADYSLEQVKQIAASDVVLYSGTGCSGDDFRTFTNTQSSGSKFPLCSKHYPGGAEVKANVKSIKVMPGVKATLHSFCSPAPLADGACNLETFSTDITSTATETDYWCAACSGCTGADDCATCNAGCLDNGNSCSSDNTCISGNCDNGVCGAAIAKTVETQTGEYFSTPGTWQLVFHQKSGQFKNKNEWGNVNTGDSNCANGKCSAFSTLDSLEDVRSKTSDGKFMFKQVWDTDSSGVGSKYNVWKQSTNPFTSGENSHVSGYEALDIRHRGRYSYQTLSWRSGYNRHTSCFLWWCWSWYSYYSYPVWTTQFIDLFGGLHRSSSPAVVLDGVTNGRYNYLYQQMANFGVGTTPWNIGSALLSRGVPADVGHVAGDVKLYVWVDTLDVSNLKHGNNNLQSVRLVGAQDCKVTLFDGSFSGASQTFGVGEHAVSSMASTLRLYRDPHDPAGEHCPTKDQILRVDFKQRWDIFDDPNCVSGCRCDSCGNAGPHCTKPLNPTRSYPGIRINPEITNAALAALDNTNGKEAICVAIPDSVSPSAVNLVGTSGAELDFTIAETGKSCLADACDSNMVKCNLDETCRPILASALAGCDGGADDSCFEDEYQKSRSNYLFSEVYTCVVNSKCLTHYDWAKDKSSFSEASRRVRKTRRLIDDMGSDVKLVAGSAVIGGSGKIFSDTCPGLESARQPNPEYQAGLVEATASHSTIVVNVDTDLDMATLAMTVEIIAPAGAAVTVNVNAGSEEGAAATAEVSASLVLKGVTKSQFNAVKQLSFRKAVGKAASISWSQVSIQSISTVGRRLTGLGDSDSRALAAASILVAFTINADSEEEGYNVERTMASSTFMATLTEELSASGVIDDASSQSFTFDTDSIVKKNIPAAKKNKKTSTEAESTGKTSSMGFVMGIVIAVLSFVALAAFCMKGKSAKVAEAPSMGERKDVQWASARGSSFSDDKKASEVSAPSAVGVPATTRLEM